MKPTDVHGGAAWEQFIKKGFIDTAKVRPFISRSWERCRKQEVNPLLTEGIVVQQNVLKAKQKKFQRFLEISRPFMETLYQFVAGSGFLVFVTDKDGNVLEMTGDHEVKQLAECSKIGVGIDLKESRMGTSGVGIVLVEKKPVQVIAKEHYCKVFHEWTCSAAPIFGIKGELTGVLNVSGHYLKAHPHTLGMVVAAAKAIGNELHLNDINNELRLAYHYSNTIMESISDGLLSVDIAGKVTHINTIAKKMLCYNEKKAGLLYSSLLQKVNEVLENGYPFFNKEMFNEKGERFLVTAVPVKNDSENITGAVVVLKESRVVHQFVAKVVGATANYSFGDLIGKSEKFMEAVNIARKSSLSDSIIMIQGESGTGKDLLAQAIHNESQRKRGPFIALNCAALPRELVGSELFGYEEGAFTGAKKGGRAGKFELANGGTLFLDEIGDMPLDLQSQLLRVLEEKKIMRLGGDKLIPVDVRIIVATNKNLKKLVNQGTFREDLYYRLNVLSVTLPPLRERGDDVILLAEHFVNKLNKQLGKNVKVLEKELKELFRKYEWPGNIREMQNMIEKAMHFVEGDTLLKDHFPEVTECRMSPLFSEEGSLKTLLQYERDVLLFTLEKHHWNISRTAEVLGIARNTLYNKIKKMGLSIAQISNTAQ